jgi:hypothetical protein
MATLAYAVNFGFAKDVWVKAIGAVVGVLPDPVIIRPAPLPTVSVIVVSAGSAETFTRTFDITIVPPIAAVEGLTENVNVRVLAVVERTP